METYFSVSAQWPKSGRHILATYDDETIVVYQAYSQEIASYAVQNQRFGGAFSYTRMSWIKPNFLWMMYRSGWATRLGQECILAIHITRRFFEWVLSQAVSSSFVPHQYASIADWQLAVSQSTVRFQWDPDHSPTGGSLARRAIQIGLRGKSLQQFGEKEIVSIQDISTVVAEQRQNVNTPETLWVPHERVYNPCATVQKSLGMLCFPGAVFSSFP